MQSPYIENCFSLTPKRIDDCLNRIGRKIGDNTDPECPDLKYEYDQNGEQYYKIVIVGGNEPQRIAMETVALTSALSKNISKISRISFV